VEEQLTTEEFIELIGVTTTSINSQFELWLTVTFAVIVASYLAGHRLSTGLRYLIATLYSLVSVLLGLMLLQAVQTADFLLGEKLTAIAWSDPLRVTIATLRFVVWGLGTIATLVFIFRNRDDAPDAQRIDKADTPTRRFFCLRRRIAGCGAPLISVLGVTSA
jgi:hypothetical protein